MSQYAAGRRVEYAVIDHLKSEGYDVQRAASSKGIADVIAVKEGQVCFVSVKKTSMPGPAERADLWRVANLLDCGVPLVALGPSASLSYRRLTGLGARDWEHWAPDFTEGSVA